MTAFMLGYVWTLVIGLLALICTLLTILIAKLGRAPYGTNDRSKG